MNRYKFFLIFVFHITIAWATTEEDDIRKEKEIRDILDTSDIEEGRLFNFDRANAFNTSVAFTIPLFSFTLPGAADSIDSGLDEGNTFGVLAFVALFLLGGLGVAIYTTSQGGNEDATEFERSFSSSPSMNSNVLLRVLDSISGFEDAIGVKSCARLGVCEAHAHPSKYGWFGLPIRLLFPADETTNQSRSLYSEAALYGVSGEDECYYQYPCLIQPLDTAIYVTDYMKRNLLKLVR